MSRRRSRARGSALRWVAAAVATIAGPGLAAAQEAPTCNGLSLTDVASGAGLGFTHERGETGRYQLPETIGGGVAWIDYDRDGWLDLYFVQSGKFPPTGDESAMNRMFRNRGDGTFVDVTEETGTGDRSYGIDVTVADVDGNGWPDLYLGNYGPDRLYLNQGNGTFRDATEESGLGLDGWSTGSAFNDADLDGDLDLYVVRYVQYDPDDPIVCRDSANDMQDYCHPNLYLGAFDRFYRNLGGGRFEDATESAGLSHADGKGLGVMFSDFDGDRYPDIYVANDSTINLMFHNRGNGTFEDVSLLSGTAVSREGLPQAGMGVALGDVDGDLDPDLTVTNLDNETNALYVNQGMMMFEEVSATSGFGIPSFSVLGFGIVLQDLDLDGDLDVYITNGNVRKNPSREGITHAMADLLLLADGTGDFFEVDCGPALDLTFVGRGLAAGDFDNDGDVDLAIGNSGGPAQLIRNDLPPRPWLGVELVGEAPNTYAVGARVTLTTRQGSQVRWRTAGDSYVATSDHRMLFGWRDGDAPVELTVLWPSGATQTRTITADEVGAYVRVQER